MLNELARQEIDEPVYEGFKLNSLQECTWAFRKLAALNDQQREYETVAEKEIERIQNWINIEREKINNQRAFFEGLLTEYALEQKKGNPKYKLSTPFGKLGFRKQPVKWNINDEILLHNLKASGLNNLIRVKEEVNKAELKKVASVIDGLAVIDGEVLEGIEIVEQEEAIKIEVAE